jgi:AP-1 complex subunit beta-1
MELKEYASEVDVAFVRKSVRAIGRCAIKLERAAERCINVLLELIRSGVNYVVQEAICVIKDIFRKYPNRSVLHTACVIEAFWSHSSSSSPSFTAVSHKVRKYYRHLV